MKINFRQNLIRALTAFVILFTLIIGQCVPMLAAAEAPAQAAIETIEPFTFSQARDIVISAASKYREGLDLSDIVSDYPYGMLDGAPDEQRPITRIEAFVMISRAFGELPEPVGDTLRKNPDPVEYTDIPDWALSAISNLNRGHVLAAPVVFDENYEVVKSEPAPLGVNDPITSDELNVILARIYALYGTRPQDDLYAWVNKQWLDSSVLPEGEEMLDLIGGMETLVGNQELAMYNDVLLHGSWEKGTRERKAADYYNTILDMNARNSTGIEELKPYLDAVESAESLNDLENSLVKIASDLAFYPLLDFNIGLDAEGLAYNLFLTLTLDGHRPDAPDESVEPVEPDKPDTLADYQKHVEQLFTLVNDKDPSYSANAALEIAVELGQARAASPTLSIWDEEPESCTPQRLSELLPNADIPALYATTRLKEASVYTVEPQYIRAIEALGLIYDEAHLDSLKAYVKYMLLDRYSETLSQDLIDALGDYGNMAIYGSDLAETAWNATSSQFAYVFDDLYAERYLPLEADMDVLYMVYDFIAYYKERIASLDWMSEATRQAALKKMDGMTVKVGRPVVQDDLLDLCDIRGLSDGGSYFSNLAAAEKAKRVQRARKQDQPVDKFDWGVLRTTTINAYYDPENNQIMLPAAFLQTPLYEYGAPDEQNLARVGWIIGHEITHAFDVNGSQYDENGQPADWWTDEDKAAFEKLCALLSEHYDRYEVAPGVTVDGENTIPENTADLGGLSCALAVLEQRSENPDYQLFFTNMAQWMVSTMTRDLAIGQTLGDIHSPDKARVNKVIQTIPEFYEAFDVQPGDGMYLAPEERIRIW
ncbi:endopeptidase [Clostridia bacterium]|nr:endopeptidase [Clostridia bacterium]